MNDSLSGSIKARIERIRELTSSDKGSHDFFQAVSIAQSVIYDTVGSSHPVMSALENSITDPHWTKSIGATRAVIDLYEQGALTSPRLAIAGEIETDLLATSHTPNYQQGHSLPTLETMPCCHH